MLGRVIVGGVLLFAGVGCTADRRGGEMGRVDRGGVFWHEGEDFVAAPEAVGDARILKGPASGGKALSGNAFKVKGGTVRYAFAIGEGMEDAQICFRYARLHWRETMRPSKLGVELKDSSGAVVGGEAEFADTKGWGNRGSEWGLATVKLGSLKAGEARLKLTGPGDDNDVVIDGFWISPADRAMKAEDLALSRILIGERGYVGLASSTTIRQGKGSSLAVAVKEHGGKGSIRRVTIGKSGGTRKTLSAMGEDAGASVVRYGIPEMADGDYLLAIEGERGVLSVPVTLAGKFLGELEGRIGALERFSTGLASSKSPGAAERLAEFQHAIEFLKGNQAKLLAAAAPAENARREGLSAQEGITNPTPVIVGMRAALKQYEETKQRLESGRDPYAGRTGDLRLARRSSTGQLQVFRVWVPSSYEKAKSLPVILMLHGGGGDENYFPELEGGKVLQMAEERGYMLISPAWRSARGSDGPQVELRQLLAMMQERYPKIDASRYYCTGISMGGGGTYAMVTRYPELFAVACGVAGSGGLGRGDAIPRLPTMILQGGADQVASPENAKRAAARLKEAGVPMEFHLFPTHGHGYHAEEYFRLTVDFFDRHRRK